MRRAAASASSHPAGPIPDAGKGEGDEDEEKEGMRVSLPTTPRNCIPRRSISVLEKLVKTYPVWLQLGLGQAEAARILQQEVAGMFLVCRDSSRKRLVLCVHFPSLKDSSAEVLEYPIKEEKSIVYLEGSVLVFEDIFRLIAFYCVSRDLLPFTLRLPQAILEASSFQDLETISNLGLVILGPMQPVVSRIGHICYSRELTPTQSAWRIPEKWSRGPLGICELQPLLCTTAPCALQPTQSTAPESSSLSGSASSPIPTFCYSKRPPRRSGGNH